MIFFILLVSLLCPVAFINGITLGKYAEPGQIPYHVSIFYDYDHHCSGSIISEQYILTAAHCVVGFDTTRMEIVVGIKDLVSEDGLIFAISEFIAHENFQPPSFNNDIAIIRLNDSLTLGTQNVNKIELASAHENYLAGTMATVSGWGSVNQYMELSTQLKYNNVTLLSREECKQLYKEGFTDNMLCAFIPGSLPSPCQGDSGGPLVQNDLLYGVVSWTKYGCFVKDRPIVYVNIIAVRDWIYHNSGI